ncbi:MAG: monofunctional biosynthetic peptidoglycan transglycosylase [Chitinophagaceae bacterium]
MIRSIWRVIKRIFIYLFIAQLIYIIVLKWVNPPTTVTMIGNRISLIGSNDHFHKDWVSYKNISSYAKLAVMAGEDQLFPVNNGFDIKAIKQAWLHNQHSKRIRGASTISQQTAKNVFLWQGRDWFRKGLEVYFTFMIEKIWGKKRILEVYLNVTQMGPHTFGIGAAAEQYYHKSAKSLSAAQAAMIAACLPDPYRYKVQPPARITVARQQWILGQMDNLEGYPDIQNLIRQ